MNEALPLLAVLLAAAALSSWYRRRNGTIRTSRAASQAAGARSLVLFTLPGCALCGPARRVVDGVAGPRGIVVDTVDIAEVPQRAAEAAVRRAPTTLVLGPDGAELGRIGGVPDSRDLAAVLDGVPP